MTYTFDPGERPAGELRRIAAETLDEAIALARSVGPSDAEGADRAVHEVRKACKRLRALVRLFRPGFEATYRRENAAARDAAAGLAHFRDARVLCDTCRKLEDAQQGVTRQAVRATRKLLQRSAGDAPAAEIAAALSESAARLAEIRERVGKWEVSRPKRAVAEGARRVYGDGRRALVRCRTEGPAEPWHDWRKQAKYHGYHARLFMAMHPAAPAYYQPFDTLGQTLGDEHDLSVLLAILEQLDLDQPTRAATARAASLTRAALREAASDLGRETYRCPPRAVGALVLGFFD
ncbi:CHAD domain-containing protein [Botrimarina sp.]|uniref:CHAD domain-containing protein n=1 Tax=Botrimarina sp. TaxID=2795802 RepID=UPI0032EDBF15